MVREAKKKKSKIRTFVMLLLMADIAIFGYRYIITTRYQHMLQKGYDDITSLYSSLKIKSDSSKHKTTQVPLLKPEQDNSAKALAELKSPNAILIRLKDQTTLMEKNSEEKIYPASLTKMMTAIVAIENLPDINKKIELTNSTFKGLYGADASMAGFKAGEQVSAVDLLYGILLPSGAECCIGLADEIAGSEQNFVKMMNQKAVKLGMKNTHFENATGLQNKNHYTTVKDLAILLSYALKNDTFREVFTSSRHSTKPTNIHPHGITFNSTMFEELKNPNIKDGEILGGKTGFTDEAGLCLASLAKVGKQEYILISAGAKGDHNTQQYNITDAVNAYSSIGK